MKTNSLLKSGLALALGITAVASTTALATPYATCLTNNAGVVSFRLNESADNVKVIWNGGATTNDLGAVSRGLTVTNLGVTGVFKIQCTKSSASGWTDAVVNQISDDTNNFVKFAQGRGLAINNNPASPYFGRVYVSLQAAGTVSSNQYTLGSRSTGDGIYLLNADQTDAVGQGNTARTGGISFSSTESPHRLAVGQDDNLYISDWSDPTGGIYVTDPNVSPGSGTNLLAGLGGPFPVTSSRIHGSTMGIVAEGSLANNNLVVYWLDEDLQEDRDTTVRMHLSSLWRADIGAGPLPYSNWPMTRLISPGVLGSVAAQLSELRRGPDGKFYVSQRRADPANTAGAFVISADGTTQLWDSLSATRQYLNDSLARDFCNETRGIDVTRDGKYMATFNGSTNAVVVFSLVDGVPDVATVRTMPTVPTTSIGRALAFDAAGNLYTLSSGQELLRIYSPGGYKVTTTGSDGTFQTFTPEITQFVSLTTPATEITEGGAPIDFTITRVAADMSQPLAVRFNVSGTAAAADYFLRTNGVNLATNWVTIPAGGDSVNVSFVANDDSLAEFAENLLVAVSATSSYGTTNQTAATFVILDNEAPVVDVSAVSGMGTAFEGTTNDYSQFRVTRRGDTNTAIMVNVNYAGTAVSGTDYAPNTPVNVDIGIVSQTFEVHPIDDSAIEMPETIVVTLAAGSGYTVGTNSVSGTGTILDDDLPSENVIWSENFATDVSANWTRRFAAANELDDYRSVFAYDYASGNPPPGSFGFPILPAAPRGNDTLGLYMTVNKDESSPIGAAGINFYPNGRSFSGNYALRFDMYLMVGNAASTTEYALFGINHSGNATNWFRNSAGGITNGTYDGLFFGVEADAAALGDYNLYTATNGGFNPRPLSAGVAASTLTGTFKSPPWAYAGSPGNLETSLTPNWAQVEVSQVGRHIKLKINNTSIMTYSNATSFTAGNIMLGYTDAYDSIMGGNSCVIYDNVRVVGINPPKVVPVSPTFTGNGNTNVVVKFTFDLDEPTTAFKLQRAPDVTGPYADVTATIAKTGIGAYTATANGARQTNTVSGFFRVRYTP